MSRFFSSALLVALIGVSGTANAKSVGYECKIDASAGQGWLPEVLFIGHDQVDDSVVVSDPIILHYNDRKPINGRVKTDNNKRTTFAWTVKIKDRSNHRATINYTATYLKATGVLSMSGLPLGYTNIFTGKGKCEVKPLK
ncbi:hypothetical protein [Primorskyibacter sp. 2E233]|uniref:hypothetical protein n=1 Tax=Primorskyibacter sp. 2E233 TaxID=3413431 RepID=UPI003BF0DFD5